MTPAPAPQPSATRDDTLSRPTRMLVLALLGIGLIFGTSWFFVIRPRMLATGSGVFGSDAGGETTLKESTSGYEEFDRVLELPGSPLGAASNGDEIVLANRVEPWGLIRIRHDGTRHVAEKILLIEPRYRQRYSISALTWNGKNYIGYTSGAWFGSSTNDVFTIHDPESLRVLETRNAPPLLGGLAWDGSSYWASTRKNTADADEEAFLYRLDRDFKVVSKSKPPAIGCQGLAWDGSHLWFVDVFSDSIYVLDVSAGEPRLVHKASTPFSYLSGVISHDGAIWVTDYDANRLQRLREGKRAAWTGTSAQPETALASALGGTPASGGSRDGSIDELRLKLRSQSWSERMRARMELDRIGAPIDFAREENNFVDREPEDTEDIDWSIELRDGGVWLASSRVWFGHELFVQREQTSTMVSIPGFARYTFTTKKPDGSESEKQFDATAGDNVLSGIRLADADAAGEYTVSLFIHVQYVDANKTGRILNNSAGFLELRK